MGNRDLVGRKITDKQKEAVSNAAKGTIFINNGLISKRISKDLKIPDGWVRGRIKFKINRKPIK